MKYEVSNREIQRFGIVSEGTMGIAEGNEAIMFDVARSGLYSDDIGSPLREYFTNARDVHRELGKGDVPFEVKLPTTFDPMLEIRDFGTGLPDDKIVYFFGQYCASSKRDSNDSVGMFGLGCKSAFAYCDSYTVTSYFEGRAATFNFYIDESEVGKHAFLGAVDTDEPNGIKVSIQVKSSDIWRFHNKAIKTVRHFATKPVFIGIDEQPTFEQKDALISGEGWSYYGSGSPYIVMGEIEYPINADLMDDLEVWEQHLLNSELQLNMAIGDVIISPSREALKYKTKTKEAIRAKLREVKDTMVTQTVESFKNCGSLWEAKLLYNQTIQNGGGYAKIVKDSGEKIIWNGIEITDNVIRFAESMLDRTPHSLLVYSKNRKKIESNRNDKLIVTPGLTLFFDDTDKKQTGYMRRARTLIDAGNHDVYILQTSDIPALEALLGIPVTTFRSLASVAETLTNKAGVALKASSGDRRPKHQARVFALDRSKLGYRLSAASEAWQIKEIDLNGEGLYVPIERFHPTLHKLDTLGKLDSIIKTLRGLGIEIALPIYGIKKGGDAGNLIRLDEWIVEQMRNQKQMRDEHAIALGFSDNDHFEPERIKVQDLPESSSMRAYYDFFFEAQACKKSSQHQHRVAIFRYLNEEIEADTTLSDLSKEIMARYPMLRVVNEYNLDEPEVTAYIVERDLLNK